METSTSFGIDRYHGTMLKFALSDHARVDDIRLAEANSMFYVTQRKIPFAPCVGHERLPINLIRSRLDIPRLRFLKQDKADLTIVADYLEKSQNRHFKIRTVKPATIIFAGEPFADIEGPFGLTQLTEIAFEHAFDDPITVAGTALEMRLAAGHRHLSDYSLRRDGTIYNAGEVAKYSYIGGFDDTSNMEAAYTLDLNAVGTMAHYLDQAFAFIYQLMDFQRQRDANGRKKHFEEVFVEKWLDANPKGTTVLLDTLRLKMGLVHTIRAAKSMATRKTALKAVRVDSGNLAKNSRWIREMLNANGLSEIDIIPTGDIDKEKIEEIIGECPSVSGFGVGTKLKAEAKRIAGVIFKLCSIGGMPTMKLSETLGKETLPGKMQVWRLVNNDGFFAKDVVSLEDEYTNPGEITGNHITGIPLLENFSLTTSPPSVKDQADFVKQQIKKFPDIRNYRVELSPAIRTLKERLLKELLKDEIGEDGVIMVPYPD